MSYVGNTATTQAFTPAIDFFSGNGSTVAFTLSRPVASAAQVQVTVNNVAQNPTDAFTVLNNTITFTGAPSIGTNNIYVQYTSPITQIMQPGQGTVGTAQIAASTTLTTPVINGFTGSTAVVNIGSGQFYKDASGNIGIGTGSPSTYANGQVPVLVTGTGNNFATVQARTDGPSGASNGVSYGGSYGTNPINGARIWLGASGGAGQQGQVIFFTKNTDDNTNQPTERARIDTIGNLLVGTSSADGTAVGIRLYASNQIQASKSGDWSFRMGRRDSTGIITEIYYNSSRVGDIATNGSNTTYNSASDYRLKNNVQTMVGALGKVAALKPVTYKWKIDGSDGQGFIAHELQNVVPDAVRGEKDELDVDGNPVYQSIDTSVLVATLTAAIQELKAIVDTQAAKIAALEAK